MVATLKKKPKDVTDFEREQLRFFLTNDDLATALVEVNPSLAWLPILADMRLIETESQLAPWIEKNFADAEAISEVAANIHFFDSEAADTLEFGLNRTKGLSPLLLK